MTRRRVVVTGMGIVSPVGIGLAPTWDSIRNAALRRGADHALRLRDFPVQDRRRGQGFRRRQIPVAEGSAALRHVHPLRPGRDDGGRERRGARRRMAGDQERVGVCIGSGIGGLPMIEEMNAAYLEGGLRKITPFFVPGSIINMVAGLVSIRYGFQGPNLAIVSACSTANHSHRRGGPPDRVRRRRRDDRRRHRSDGQRARRRRLLHRARVCRRATTTRRRPAGHGTSTATASCWARAPASWCSRNTSTPRRAARGSTASSPATG